MSSSKKKAMPVPSFNHEGSVHQQQTTTLRVAPICWMHGTRRYKLTLARQHCKEKDDWKKNVIWSLGKLSQHKSTEHCLPTAVDLSVAADLVHRFMTPPVAISRSNVTELQSSQTMSLLLTDELHDNPSSLWQSPFTSNTSKWDNNCWMVVTRIWSKTSEGCSPLKVPSAYAVTNEDAVPSLRQLIRLTTLSETSMLAL